MALYVVERYLPEISLKEFITLQRAAMAMSQRYAAQGVSVRYIRCTCFPAESHYICLFEAPEAKLVQEINEAAEVPFVRIIEALELVPEWDRDVQ